MQHKIETYGDLLKVLNTLNNKALEQKIKIIPNNDSNQHLNKIEITSEPLLKHILHPDLFGTKSEIEKEIGGTITTLDSYEVIEDKGTVILYSE